jgi:DnaK suppressor protein
MGLKKKELDQFEKLLNTERDKILGHLQDLSSSSEKDLENNLSGDPADIASLEINQANMQKIGKREAYLLKKIEKALAKIKEKTYGECENCGEEIGLARLEARPVAELCIDCKTEQEQEERRYSSTGEQQGDDDFDFQEVEEG